MNIFKVKIKTIAKCVERKSFSFIPSGTYFQNLFYLLSVTEDRLVALQSALLWF